MRFTHTFADLSVAENNVAGWRVCLDDLEMVLWEG
jgi:hypothetical protein